MRTDVLTTQVRVAREGGQQYFSMNLPVDVVRIVGVETGIRMSSALRSSNRQTAGTIRLQAAEKPNICFCGDVKIGGEGIDGLSPGFIVHVPVKRLVSWASLPYVGGGAMEPENISLKDCRTIYGCYTDELGKANHTDLSYTVTLYLWIEVRND